MLHFGLRTKLDPTTYAVVTAVAVLHNMAILNREPDPPNLAAIPQIHVPVQPAAERNAQGNIVRRQLIQRFSTNP